LGPYCISVAARRDGHIGFDDVAEPHAPLKAIGQGTTVAPLTTPALIPELVSEDAGRPEARVPLDGRLDFFRPRRSRLGSR